MIIEWRNIFTLVFANRLKQTGIYNRTSCLLFSLPLEPVDINVKLVLNLKNVDYFTLILYESYFISINQLTKLMLSLNFLFKGDMQSSLINKVCTINWIIHFFKNLHTIFEVGNSTN